MFRVTLTFVLLSVTSCLTSPTSEKEASPLCKDLESLAKWNAGKDSEQRYLKLQEICTEGDNVKGEKPANDVVDRIVRCGKIEHTDDMTDTVKKELDSCNLELNCYKRFYMEGAKLEADDHKTEFPLVWRGKKVKIESPPSETFVDSDQSKPCSKYAKKKQDLLASEVTNKVQMDLEKVKGDLMKQIYKDIQEADKVTAKTNTDPKEEDIFDEIDKLVSDIIDGIVHIMTVDVMSTDSQAEVQKVMEQMKQLLALIAKHKKNGVAASLLDTLQQGLSTNDQLSPIDRLVNYMFDSLKGKDTSKLVQPHQDEMDYYSQVAKGGK